MTVDWKNYSEVYDLMAVHNPAYREIMAGFEHFLEEAAPGPGAHLADFGAGTGNFSVRAAALHAGLRVTHVDSDPGMNARARRKAGNIPVRILETSLEQVAFARESLHLAVCVHSLYTIRDPHAFLGKLHGWMEPGGKVFLCDLGRVLDLSDWRKYFFANLMGSLGLLQTLRIFWKGRNVVRQNRNIAKHQRDGRYWVHSPGEFSRAVEEAGFHILHSTSAYRGYSDLVIAERPRVGG